MSKLSVVNIEGKQVGEYELPDDLLVYDRGLQAVHDAVVLHRRRCRAFSASTKGKSEVKATRAKPWRQKGLGRARSGYRTSPIWRGGGVAFGPTPGGAEKKMPKKVSRLAFRRAFSDKVAGGQILLVQGLSLDAPKTKAMAKIKDAVAGNQQTLFVVGELEKNIVLSSRNLAEADVATARQVDTYTLLRFPLVVIAEEAMDSIKNRLQGNTRSAS